MAVHLFVPEALLAALVLYGVPPRAAMVLSDAVLWPLDRAAWAAWERPCVALQLDRPDERGRDHVLVEGPPTPERLRRPYGGPARPGYATWNCYDLDVDPQAFQWRSRGVSAPMPPWRTAQCLLSRWCRDADLFAGPYGAEAPVPWP